MSCTSKAVPVVIGTSNSCDDVPAEAAGIDIDFAAITRTPNTLDAHRVIHWAGLEGCQTPLVAALFKAYFREGRDIGAHKTLVAVAAGAGLDPKMIGTLLEGDADRADIQSRDAHARARGVTGVPTFVVANSHVVPGAQPPELWARVIEDIAAESGTA